MDDVKINEMLKEDVCIWCWDSFTPQVIEMELEGKKTKVIPIFCDECAKEQGEDNG